MCVNVLLRLGSHAKISHYGYGNISPIPNIRNASDPKHLNEGHSDCNLLHEGLGPYGQLSPKGSIPQSCHIGIRAAT